MSDVFHSKVKLGEKLGNGFFGDVYHGTDPAHGPIAVKVVSRERALPPEDVYDDAKWAIRKEAIHKEARYLSQAAHRNVVPVHSVIETQDGNAVQICMAFCPGGSLQSAYEQDPMTLSSARKFATEVLMGLGALHNRGMLHRDIKPANILRDATGVAQISDFGLVTDDLLLGYASQAGYRDHIAFEIWNGGLTSVRSDIWAFGMTLYRMLHGKTWYEEGPRPQLIVKLGKFADTLEWLPHIPSSWRRAIRTMLRDDPSARCQNCDQAMNALSTLPIVPAWAVNVTPGLIRWELLSAKRKNIVEWTRHSDRKHHWSAWSEPLASGRRKTLGGSGGIVGKRQALSELERYFSA
ncbi:MAG: serine/threonine protein kinase [Mesorhizobium sp.]|nr:MAG: serine/threonine protein kinase [Mesorhizobium sp.]